jgi:hypothetical protein
MLSGWTSKAKKYSGGSARQVEEANMKDMTEGKLRCDSLPDFL